MRTRLATRTVLALTVFACAANTWASPRPRVHGYGDWELAVLERQLDPREVVYPFEATPEMMAWADEKLRSFSQKDDIEQLSALQNALFNTNYFFTYDTTKTLGAADAFAAREGNCISFTSLFVAISRGLGFPTFLVSVRRAPGIEKADGVVVVNNHVVAAYRSPRKVHIYDFSTASTEQYFHQRVIDDLTASAIFHTNLGGASIRSGDLFEARRHLEIATTLAPQWAPAWINLGVARFRSGDAERALDAYRSALVNDPLNTSALTNMSVAFASLGRQAEAETALRAAAEDTRSPYTLVAMADVDMAQGDLESARRRLRRARWLYGKEPEVYYAMARLASREGDETRAGKHARHAAELRQQRSDRVATP